MGRLKSFVQKETVLIVSALAAGISMLFVHPSGEYIGYIDFRVLTLLFCLMAVVSGLQKVGLFAVVGQKIVAGSHNTRYLCLTLILLCFFSSMLITNDVALITFVPFSIMVLTMTGQMKHSIPVIVLQTIAANLGSMLTPVGNPQNLYLYSYYQLSPLGFFRLTMSVTGASLLLLLLSSFFFKPEHIQVRFTQDNRITDCGHLYAYSSLFVLCLLCVFHIIPYYILLFLIAVPLLLIDRALFRTVDYGLLATFVCFFLFVGNLGRIEPVKAVMSRCIEGHEFISAILLSQVISNVPAAVLLSGFTDKSADLILGADIGGLGTLVASLASLISFKLYAKSEEARTGRYLLVFTIANIAVLLLLILFSMFLR